MNLSGSGQLGGSSFPAVSGVESAWCIKNLQDGSLCGGGGGGVELSATSLPASRLDCDAPTLLRSARRRFSATSKPIPPAPTMATFFPTGLRRDSTSAYETTRLPHQRHRRRHCSVVLRAGRVGTTCVARWPAKNEREHRTQRQRQDARIVLAFDAEPPRCHSCREHHAVELAAAEVGSAHPLAKPHREVLGVGELMGEIATGQGRRAGGFNQRAGSHVGCPGAKGVDSVRACIGPERTSRVSVWPEGTPHRIVS